MGIESEKRYGVNVEGKNENDRKNEKIIKFFIKRNFGAKLSTSYDREMKTIINPISPKSNKEIQI